MAFHPTIRDRWESSYLGSGGRRGEGQTGSEHPQQQNPWELLEQLVPPTTSRVALARCLFQWPRHQTRWVAGLRASAPPPVALPRGGDGSHCVIMPQRSHSVNSTRLPAPRAASAPPTAPGGPVLFCPRQGPCVRSRLRPCTHDVIVGGS